MGLVRHAPVKMHAAAGAGMALDGRAGVEHFEFIAVPLIFTVTGSVAQWQLKVPPAKFTESALTPPSTDG